MSTEVQISFIIPTYNLENYIGATLESVLSLKDLSFEIIVVDDHSQDKTKDIVVKYAKKYPCIKLVSNERTKGVSGARNTGLKHVQGKTTFFLDGDDLIISSALKTLFDCLEKNASPFVRGNLIRLCYQRWLSYEGTPLTSTKADEYPTGSFGQYLYDTHFLKNNSIFFPEDCSIGEDLTFFCRVFALTDTSKPIPSIDNPIYLYRINHKRISPSVQHAFSFMKHFIYVRQLFERHDKMKFFPSYIQAQLPHRLLDLAYYAQKDSQESIDTYLTDCSKVLAGMKEELAPILLPLLKEQSDLFWKACNIKDTENMLLALQNTKLMHAICPYMGIKESQVKSPFWKIIRILHRTRSILNDPKSFKNFLHVHQLERKSKQFLKQSQ